MSDTSAGPHETIYRKDVEAIIAELRLLREEVHLVPSRTFAWFFGWSVVLALIIYVGGLLLEVS